MEANFIILPKAEIPDVDLKVITFHFGSHGSRSWEWPAGHFVGNPHHDEEFRKKLERIRGRLQLHNVEVTISYAPFNPKLERRRSNEDNYRRLSTKYQNALNKALDNIRKSSPLFADELIEKANASYNQLIDKLKKRYPL